MSKHSKFAAMVVTLALVGGAMLSGCGPTVPANPTWQADVYPLLLARCIRCHDSQMRGDPGGRNAIGSFNFATVAEAAPAIQLLHLYGSQVIRGPVPPAISRMPPPPAEALADWEIQVLDNWLKESIPQ